LEFVPGAAVGAVGVPVKLGDAIVARNAMSAILVVILAVFDVTLVSNAASALVALVISEVILAVLDEIFNSLVVTLVGKVVIVDELTPPTLLMVVGNVPVPLPETSPVKVIN
jgi:hypothetical protein